VHRLPSRPCGASWHRRLRLLALTSATLAGSASVDTAAAQERSQVPDSAARLQGTGIGVSYWGEIPAPTDSATARFANRPASFWEAVLVSPYRVITFPFRAVGAGILATVEFMDDKQILDIFIRPPGNIQLFPEITAGGLSGFGGGLSIQHNHVGAPGNELRLRAYTTVRGDQRITGGAQFPIGRGGMLGFGAGFRDRANARYFGNGPETSRFDESFYRQRLTWLGTSYRQRIGNFLLRGKLLYTGVSAGEPGGDFEPSLSQRFADDLPSGFGERSDGVSLEVLLGHADFEETGRPTRGGLRQLRASYFLGTDPEDNIDFWTFRAELQQFIPLWYNYHALALRWYLSWIEPMGQTTDIPFQRLLTNDDPDLMRGYNDFRWRDRGITVLSAEYRWPLWAFQHAAAAGLDIYILADLGQVFDELDQINLDNLTFSYGLGLRLVDGQGFLLRVEFARSSEQSMFRLKSEQIFQWTKGLFHGKDPVPPR
jgi:hypothetical protein